MGLDSTSHQFPGTEHLSVNDPIEIDDARAVTISTAAYATSVGDFLITMSILNLATDLEWLEAVAADIRDRRA